MSLDLKQKWKALLDMFRTHQTDRELMRAEDRAYERNHKITRKPVTKHDKVIRELGRDISAI